MRLPPRLEPGSQFTALSVGWVCTSNDGSHRKSAFTIPGFVFA